MKTEIYISKLFVIEWSTEDVWCESIDENDIRIFKIKPLFQGMKLFKGKNVWIETKIIPGTMFTKCYESNKRKIVQLWNFYIKKNFFIL